MIEIDKIKIKISEFYNEYKLYIFMVVLAIILLLLFNYFLTISRTDEVITTRDPFAFVMTPKEKIPAKLHIESESMISYFAESAIKGDYETAYNLLSHDAKRTLFDSVEDFKKYAKTNFPEGSRYEIIPYSKVGTTYVYQVKVFEDFLKTGLTYSDYSYIDLKMAINENKKGEKLLSVAGFMGRFTVNSVFENEYMRVEVSERKSFYAEEIYAVSILNRTEHDLIIKDFGTGGDEVQLNVGGDYRTEIENTTKIVIPGFERKELIMGFPRFFDESIIASSINFSSVRLVPKGMEENYTENDIIAKFSAIIEIVD